MTEKEVLEIIEKAAREHSTVLDLSEKGVKSLPGKIGGLTNLEKLYLSNNQLTSVPGELGQLENLRELYLFSNRLTSVPPELGQLKNLVVLSLSYNQLTKLPSESIQLKNLWGLNLSGNQLRSLPGEWGQLEKLEQLYLDNNQLTSVPGELGRLEKLAVLRLEYNQLTSLPAELGQLGNLMHLCLKYNQLTSLPGELGRLTKLKYLDLDGNRLEFPPPEVVEQGTEAVLAYLRELAKGAKKRYEAKLLLLGDGGEGKTCVSRALRGLKFEPQVTTEGVDIVPWRFKHPDYAKDSRKNITLNIWDFEGQEINHQSHQFFLTQRALYLLVFKGREQFNRPRVEYWLDIYWPRQKVRHFKGCVRMADA
ncbi:MAG: leucine-rich repeat domain-containing protein [Planctomycetota bacterium]|jgi:hypothetical protein